MDTTQDFFISHASADKEDYVQPLADALSLRKVTFWLDSSQIEWGDSLTQKVNEGLRDSRHVVLCLSKTFLGRPWPTAELGAAVSRQFDIDERRVLPLILNSAQEVLAQYPLLADLNYREYGDADTTADELARLIGQRTLPEGHLQISIESVHTGRLSRISVSSRASIEWLAGKARRGAGLADSLETGGFQPFAIRWVLVDVNAEGEWQHLSSAERRNVHAMVHDGNDIRIATEGRQRLRDVGVPDGAVFHLYAVEDTTRNDLAGGLVFSG